MLTTILDVALAVIYGAIATMETSKWQKRFNAALSLFWFLLAILNAFQAIVE